MGLASAKMIGLGAIALTMSWRQNAGAGEAEEQVGPFDHIGQGGGGGALRKGRFLRGHLRGAALVDQPFKVAKPDVLAFDAQLHQHLKAGDPRRAAAGGDDLDVLNALARDDHGIGGRSTDHDSGAVLIVVEDRDLHPLAAQLFDDEAVGGLDVFQVHRAKGRLQRADDFGQLYRVGFVHFDVETVDIGEFLEEDGLALHHRLRGQRADVAKAKDSGAVRDHGDEVALAGIAAGGGGVGLDLKAGLGHAGGVGAGKVAAIGQGLRRADFQLSGLRKFVIVQRRLPCVVVPSLVHQPLLRRWFSIKPVFACCKSSQS